MAESMRILAGQAFCELTCQTNTIQLADKGLSAIVKLSYLSSQFNKNCTVSSAIIGGIQSITTLPSYAASLQNGIQILISHLPSIQTLLSYLTCIECESCHLLCLCTSRSSYHYLHKKYMFNYKHFINRDNAPLINLIQAKIPPPFHDKIL